MKSPPLIVCAKLGADSQAFFDDLRAAHFPKHINYLKAHCTLFHHLPSDNEQVLEALRSVCADTSKFTATVQPPRHTGFGVSYRLEVPELLALGQKIISQLDDAMLIPQDQNKKELHITVQNKATAYASKELAAKLQKSFEPMQTQILGLSLYHYLDGPWEWVGEYNFKS